MNAQSVRTGWQRRVASVGLVLICGALAYGGDAVPAPPKARVAFLGVSVGPVPAAEGKDLGLAEGVGLVVRLVEEQSPAQNRINVGDILVRLDEQILIHPYQLAVLVRTYSPGTEVKVSLLRGGNEMDVAVALGERDATPLSEAAWGQPLRIVAAGAGGGQPPNAAHGVTVNGGTMTINVAGVGAPANGVTGQTTTVLSFAVGDDNQRTATTVENGTSYSLSTANGVSTFTVTGADAKVLFNGPVTTAEERARVPEAYRARLEALQAPPVTAVAPPPAAAAP